jgi:hypothetical protein
VAEEVGQAPVAQPALSVPESMNPYEAVQHFTAVIEAVEKAESTPRDEKGKFVAKEEPKAEEAKPETEATEAKEEEVQEEAQPEPRKLKLKYKGEDKEFLEPEVIELAQKGYDYTQKSQALAKERDELQAKVKTESDAARSHYEQQLEIQKQSVLKLSGVKSMSDIEQLSKTDPAGAQQEFLKAIAVNQTVQAIEAEQQKIAQSRQSEMRESYTKQQPSQRQWTRGSPPFPRCKSQDRRRKPTRTQTRSRQEWLNFPNQGADRTLKRLSLK